MGIKGSAFDQSADAGKRFGIFPDKNKTIGYRSFGTSSNPHDTTTANKLSTQRYTDKCRRRALLVARLHFELLVCNTSQTEIV